MSEEQESKTAATAQESQTEQEYHPADPHFNPAHPDNAAWRSGPKSPDMPAEAGIVAMFQDPAGPIGEGDVHVEPPPPGPEAEVEEVGTSSKPSSDGADGTVPAPSKRRRS